MELSTFTCTVPTEYLPSLTKVVADLMQKGFVNYRASCSSIKKDRHRDRPGSTSVVSRDLRMQIKQSRAVIKDLSALADGSRDPKTKAKLTAIIESIQDQSCSEISGRVKVSAYLDQLGEERVLKDTVRETLKDVPLIARADKALASQAALIAKQQQSNDLAKAIISDANNKFQSASLPDSDRRSLNDKVRAAKQQIKTVPTPFQYAANHVNTQLSRAGTCAKSSALYNTEVLAIKDITKQVSTLEPGESANDNGDDETIEDTYSAPSQKRSALSSQKRKTVCNHNSKSSTTTFDSYRYDTIGLLKIMPDRTPEVTRYLTKMRGRKFVFCYGCSHYYCFENEDRGFTATTKVDPSV